MVYIYEHLILVSLFALLLLSEFLKKLSNKYGNTNLMCRKNKILTIFVTDDLRETLK